MVTWHGPCWQISVDTKITRRTTMNADELSKRAMRGISAMAALGRAASNKPEAQGLKVNVRAFRASRNKYAEDQTARIKASNPETTPDELTAYQSGINAGWSECLNRLTISGVVRRDYGDGEYTPVNFRKLPENDGEYTKVPETAIQYSVVVNERDKYVVLLGDYSGPQ